MHSPKRQVNRPQCIVCGKCLRVRSLMAQSLQCKSHTERLLVVRLVSWTESAEGQSVRHSIRIAHRQLRRRHVAGEGTPLLQEIGRSSPLLNLLFDLS